MPAKHAILAVALCATGAAAALVDVLLSAGGDGNVAKYDIEKGAVTGVGKGHIGDANTIRFPTGVQGGGNLFCTGSTDKSVRIWDVRDLKCVAHFKAAGEVNCSAFFPNGNAVASADHDGQCIVFDVRTGGKLQVFTRKKQRAATCDFSLSGRIFYVGYEDGHVGLWDTFATGKGITAKVQAHTDCARSIDKMVHNLRLAPDGNVFATGAYDGLLKIWGN